MPFSKICQELKKKLRVFIEIIKIMIGDYPINLYNQNFEISHSFISYNGDPQELNNVFSLNPLANIFGK